MQFSVDIGHAYNKHKYKTQDKTMTDSSPVASNNIASNPNPKLLHNTETSVPSHLYRCLHGLLEPHSIDYYKPMLCIWFV